MKKVTVKLYKTNIHVTRSQWVLTSCIVYHESNNYNDYSYEFDNQAFYVDK